MYSNSYTIWEEETTKYIKIMKARAFYFHSFALISFFFIISFSRCSLVCPLLHLCNRFQNSLSILNIDYVMSRVCRWKQAEEHSGAMESEKLAHDDDDYVNLLCFSSKLSRGFWKTKCARRCQHTSSVERVLQENLCEIRSRKRIFSIFCSNSNILPMAFACVCYHIHVMWCDYITLHWVYELLHCCLSDSLSIHTTARRDDKCV